MTTTPHHVLFESFESAIAFWEGAKTLKSLTLRQINMMDTGTCQVVLSSQTRSGRLTQFATALIEHHQGRIE